MHPSDVIVLATIGLPFDHQIDLMMWYTRADPREVTHPSINQWCMDHADDTMAWWKKRHPKGY
jgi:hypothetical protein